MTNDKEEPQKVKDRIFGLLDKHYKRSQLINDFGFASSTVDVAIKEYKEKHGGEVPAERGATGGKFEIIKMDAKSIIPPEQALQGIRLQDGDYKLGFIDGMGTLIMAARYNQVLAASQAETLTNQLRIMEEARKGSADVAQEAAARAAAGVGAQIMPEVEALKAQVTASSQNPMASMMTTLMMPSIQQAAAQLAQLFTRTQPGQPPQPGGNQPLPQQGNPPSIKERDISEWEG